MAKSKRLKRWCKHITIQTIVPLYEKEYQYETVYNGVSYVAGWKCCPECKTPRPK